MGKAFTSFLLILAVLLTAFKFETLSAISSKFPVDVSFLIADLKYSKGKGVKICEIQHGVLSTFYGDQFAHGEAGVIPVNFYEALLQYQDRAWAVKRHFTEVQIRNILVDAPEWSLTNQFNAIKKDPEFQSRASFSVNDPNHIFDYYGLVVARPSSLPSYRKLKDRYPGMIFLDAAARDYWIDKYKMSDLFSRDPLLATYKPKWGLYDKKDHTRLAEKIINDLQCDAFVIKPRGAFLGNGVIIVAKENLNSTLQYILKKTKKLKKDPDPSFSYWYEDAFESFLVEEFVESDPIAVEHLDNKMYQPTMRVAFLLVYSEHKINVHYLGMYWLLPFRALSESGTLNQRHKAYCKVPYYDKVDQDTRDEVERQLSEALPLLYQQMLTEE